MQIKQRGMIRKCDWCNYETKSTGNLCTHRKSCKNRPVEPDAEKEQLRQRVSADAERIQSLEQQLAAKDKQIDELLKAAREERKRPRTVNNTSNKNYNVNQQINVFGKESLAHLTEAKLQELLSDPDTSVARLVTLKHSVEENQNVRVPNRREKWVQVLKQTSDGKKVWEVVPKHDILTEIVETNAMFLEGEADESTAPGLRFSRWHERLLQSQDSDGKMFREQMDMVHNTLVESTRH
jgi:hypothetical protein